MSGPLSGYRVLELTSTVSGPMAAMVLADQGADVIKIEPPLIGDAARYMGNTRAGMGAMFAVLNRNKRSLVLNIKEQADKDIFLQLVATADVLLENYRPGVVDKLGIDYESLKKINPKLVYASISGYGQSGPYKNRKVYDPLIQATTGTVHAQGKSGEPVNMASVVYDKVTGLTTAQSITAALLQRGKTGQGQYLPISMLESALYYIWPDVYWSKTLQGDDIAHNGELADYFQVFTAKDGHIAIILISDDDLQVFCLWLGAALHEDERFSSLGARLQNLPAFKDEINKLLVDHEVDELCETLDSMNVPVAKVNTMATVQNDPQIIQQGSLVEINHPVLGEMRLPRPPFNMHEQDVFPKSHAPFLGDHSREILTQLGVGEPDIERMEQRESANRDIIKAMAAQD